MPRPWHGSFQPLLGNGISVTNRAPSALRTRPDTPQARPAPRSLPYGLRTMIECAGIASVLPLVLCLTVSMLAVLTCAAGLPE